MSTHQGTFTKPRLSTALLLGIVLAATFLVYAGTLQFEFVHDDLGQIVANPAVQSWKYFPLYFRANVWMQQLAVGNYYRPRFLGWLLLNHTLFGLHPALWHLTQILGRPTEQVAALGLAAVMAFATVAQSVPWANDLLLYYHGMVVAPNNDLPRNKMAASLVQRGMYNEGLRQRTHGERH